MTLITLEELEGMTWDERENMLSELKRKLPGMQKDIETTQVLLVNQKTWVEVVKHNISILEKVSS